MYRHLLLPSLLWALACGSTDASPSPASNDAAPDQSTGASSDAGTGSPEGGTNGDAPAQRDAAAQADSGSVAYLAYGWSGGSLIHVDIYKRDDARNLCYKLFLANPSNTAAGLTLPSSWGVIGADVAAQADGCGAPGVSGSPKGNHSGTVSFSGSSFIPSAVTLHVVLSLAIGNEPLDAVDLPISSR